MIAKGREVAEELPACGAPESPSEQVVDLRRNRCGNDQRAGLGPQDLEQRVPLWLLGLGKRDKRCRVEDQRQSPKPRISSSSGIFESGRGSVSIRSKFPARAKLRSPRDSGR